MKRIFLVLISLLLCFSLVCILSSCKKIECNLTEDFYSAFGMKNDRLVLDSGFYVRIFNVKREKTDSPKIIIDMCAVYDDADSFYQTSDDWMDMETETKQEDLHKIGEYFDAYAENRNIDNYYLYIVFHLATGKDIYDYQAGKLIHFNEVNDFKITDDGDFINNSLQ